MKAGRLVVIGVALLAAGCGSTAPATTSTTTSSEPATTSTTTATTSTTPVTTTSVSPTASSTSTTTTVTPTSSSTTTTTEPLAEVAQHYAAAATTVDAAYVTWHADVLRSTSISQLVGPAATYAAALVTFDNAVAKVGASGKVVSAVATLIAADRAVIADLDTAGEQSSATAPGWAARLSAAGASAVDASNQVRADLGLLPA